MEHYTIILIGGLDFRIYDITVHPGASKQEAILKVYRRYNNVPRNVDNELAFNRGLNNRPLTKEEKENIEKALYRLEEKQREQHREIRIKMGLLNPADEDIIWELYG